MICLLTLRPAFWAHRLPYRSPRANGILVLGKVSGSVNIGIELVRERLSSLLMVPLKMELDGSLQYQVKGHEIFELKASRPVFSSFHLQIVFKHITIKRGFLVSQFGHD